MQFTSSPILVRSKPVANPAIPPAPETVKEDWYLVCQGLRVVYAYDPAVFPKPSDVVDHIRSIEYDYRGDATTMQLFMGGILEEFAVWRFNKLAAIYRSADQEVEYQNGDLFESC